MARPNKIPTAQARFLVESLYGMPLHNPTYRNWREWAGVEKRAKWITDTQLRFMLAVALIRRDQTQRGNNRGELDETQVLEIANSDLIQDSLNRTWDYINESGLCLGKDLPEQLKEKHQISVSLSSIIRKIPEFSIVKYYNLGDVADLFRERQ